MLKFYKNWHKNRAFWALSHGILGRNNRQLAPSVTALNQENYLGISDFLKVVLVAILTHILVLVVMAIWPYQEIKQIPVKTLSFRLGSLQILDVAEQAEEAPAPLVEEDVKNSPNSAYNNLPPKIVKVPNETANDSAQNIRQTPLEQNIFESGINQPKNKKEELLINSPKQYVRKYGLPTIDNILQEKKVKPTIKELTEVKSTVLQGEIKMPFSRANSSGSSANSNAVNGIKEGEKNGQLPPPQENSAEEIKQRYEQQISSWIAQHKIYPPGKSGKLVIRIRIDRQGYVRYYALDEASGVDELDQAAIDMIRRANPVPAPPENYPSGNLIEFLIPINFEKQ